VIGPWTLVAALGVGAWICLAIVGLRTAYGIPRLDAQPQEAPPEGFPNLSVIVPCRDEAADVAAAVQSLLDQDYPALEVVAIDDRSSDATGEILDGLARRDPRLRVLHVLSLPDDFLGKTHACHVGTQAASGEVLLFTDADVYFAPGALRRAVGFLGRYGLGHLVVLPHLIAPHFLERGLVTAFSLFASAKFRVWGLSRAGTSGYIGIGAFNLVDRKAYTRVGGHAPLALEVVDDVKLGLILRRNGVPQGAVDSAGLVKVRWNSGFLKTLGGLEKNGFAGAEWRWGMTLVGAAFGAAIFLGPLCALVFGDSLAKGLALIAIVIAVAVHSAGARRVAGGSGLDGLAYPLCDAGLMGAFLWSALRATASGGVRWRGTFYPLAKLRAGCVRESAFPKRNAVGWPRR
jgi:GT2 family glycosyltransferase